MIAKMLTYLKNVIGISGGIFTVKVFTYVQNVIGDK